MLARPHPPVATAPYACKAEASRGRAHREPESATRTPFQRDRDRIVHSTAFRRLMHKTQVFVHHEGDHYRTRLTHSLEVAQIARSIARVLALDEDLAEALALAHDLGHPPFGHAGEEALAEAMRDHGGFDHNVQTLRVVTRLEARYANFDGLNLTWETLEGLAKHNGPVEAGSAMARAAAALAGRDLALDSFAGAEAQVAALADDIAYDNHDVDDGLRAGLFSIDDLASVSLVGPLIDAVVARHGALPQTRLIHETIRRMIGLMIDDVVAESDRRLTAAAPADADGLRRLGAPVIAFSDNLASAERGLKDYLFTHMYRHPRVIAKTERARAIVTELFAIYRDNPGLMPPDWRARAEGGPRDRAARVVADYIAGMTDRYASDEHVRLSAI